MVGCGAPKGLADGVVVEVPNGEDVAAGAAAAVGAPKGLVVAGPAEVPNEPLVDCAGAPKGFAAGVVVDCPKELFVGCPNGLDACVDWLKGLAVVGAPNAPPPAAGAVGVPNGLGFAPNVAG